MRTRLCLAAPVLLGLAASGCKNSLNYAPPGGPLGCSDPGAICSVGYDDIGDGGPALAASLVDPTALAYDPSGNLYIADRSQNRIRRVDPSGVITTVAGTGEESYTFVPGLPGTESVAASPISVAATADGTVFWADDRSCVLYALSPTSGTVSVAAGSRCSDGGGINPQDVLFDFDSRSRIRAHENNLVIADSQGYEVRYWNRGPAATTVAGVSVDPGAIEALVSLNQPTDMAVASDGTLYAIEADYYDCRLRRISPAGVTTFLVGSAVGGSSPCGNDGDGLPSTSGQLNYPAGIVLDENNGILVITDESGRARAVNLAGNNTTFATVALGTNGMATIAGTTSYDWLSLGADTGPALSQRFRAAAQSPVLDPDGNVVFADRANNVLRRLNVADGTMDVIAGFAEAGTLADFLNEPASVALLPDGDLLAAGRTARVWRLGGGSREAYAGTGDPIFTGDGSPATQAGLWATGVTAGADGRVFISDARNHRLRVVDPLSGTISTIAGNGGGGSGGDGGPAVNASFDGPHSALVDSSGNLFIGDYDRIRYVNLGTSPITIAGVVIAPQNIETIAGGNGETFYGDGGPALDAALRLNEYNTEYANGMAVYDRALYFTDAINNRVRKVDLATSVITTVVGSGADGADAVGRPVGLAIHDGYLYWTQLDGDLVKRMALPAGAIEIVAGDGNAGFFGEGVHASQSQLLAPQGLAISNSGEIYVTDKSHRVRRIVP